MNVRALMTEGVELLAPEATVQAAAQTMAELGCDAMLVGTAEAVLGILTHRDILIRAVAEGRDPTATLVREIMSVDLVSCGPETAADEAARQMEGRQIRRMPVLDSSGALLGLVSLDAIPEDAR